jgi:hypothetical protein
MRKRVGQFGSGQATSAVRRHPVVLVGLTLPLAGNMGRMAARLNMLNGLP